MTSANADRCPYRLRWSAGGTACVGTVVEQNVSLNRVVASRLVGA